MWHLDCKSNLKKDITCERAAANEGGGSKRHKRGRNVDVKEKGFRWNLLLPYRCTYGLHYSKGILILLHFDHNFTFLLIISSGIGLLNKINICVTT